MPNHPPFSLTAACQDNVSIIDVAADGSERVTRTLTDPTSSSVAIDPLNPDRIVVGTFDRGTWLTTNAGETWSYIGHGIHSTHVSAVAMSPTRGNIFGSAIYAGTEPANLYRSEDNGTTWEHFPALPKLPSSRTWSFPPRPWTHHTRWITPHPDDPELLFAGVELGGVMRSTDGGVTWEDRKPGSRHDCHSLTIPASDPDRLYEAAGDGVALSLDRGATWRAADDGMDRHYAWSVAVDPVDADRWYVSASTSARYAHRDGGDAQAALFRTSDGTSWEPIGERNGDPGAPLCYPSTEMPYALATVPGWPNGLIAALHNGIVLVSDDAGASFRRLETEIPGILTISVVPHNERVL